MNSFEELLRHVQTSYKHYHLTLCISILHFVMSFTGRCYILKLLCLSLIVEPLSISDIVAASDDHAKVRISYKVWSSHDECDGCLSVIWYQWFIICLDYWIRGYRDHTVRMLHSKLTLIVKQFHAMTLKKLLRFDLT